MARPCLLVLAVAACRFDLPAPLADAPGSTDADPTPRCDAGDTWEQGKQPATTIHVSTTPGPGTPDGSQANPFTTLAAAVPSIGPGTRILLGPGDHAGAAIADKQGTPDAPIWIEGPPSGAPARIAGGTTRIHLIRGRYWVIRDLEVASITQQPGINVDDGGSPGSTHHLVIERVKVASVARACVQLTGVTDVVIRDSALAACERGVMLVGVQHGTIARLNIAGVATAGVAMSAGSEDIEVRQSVIAEVQNGIGVWIGGDSAAAEFRPPLAAPTGNTEARNIRVFDNVIRDTQYAVTCSNCTSSLVAHNLIRRTTGQVLRLVQPYTAISTFQFAPAGGVRLANNAIEVGSGAEAVLDGGNGTSPASCTFSHNMWFRSGGVWAPALPSMETMGIYDTVSGYSDGGRLCASTGSRAAGAGTPLAEVPGTQSGKCRSSPPSIGPSEPDPGCRAGGFGH